MAWATTGKASRCDSEQQQSSAVIPNQDGADSNRGGGVKSGLVCKNAATPRDDCDSAENGELADRKFNLHVYNGQFASGKRLSVVRRTRPR